LKQFDNTQKLVLIFEAEVLPINKRNDCRRMESLHQRTQQNLER